MAELARGRTAPPVSSAGGEALTRILAPHRPALALLLLAGLLYLPAVWNRDVWNPDEPRYAEVAREMVATGEYFVPHLNGEIYAEKPPLYFWLAILAERVPFVPEGAGVRLVSALAALGTLWLTFAMGRDLATARAGWLAALLLATAPLFAQHASAGVIDSLLTFLATAAVRLGLAARAARSGTLWAGFYATGALAILTKGPVGLIVPAGTLLVLSVAERGWRGLFARHVLWGTLLMAAICACWLVPAILRGGQAYAEIILLRQTVGRAYNSWHHRESAGYFLRVFPASFVPWLLFLPAAIVAAVARLRRKAEADPEGRAADRVALAWFLFTFIFFSLMSGKKTRYLLPLFPAVCLLAATHVERLIRPAPEPAARRQGRWAWGIPFALCAALLLLLGLGIAAAGLGAAAPWVERIRGLAPDQREALAWLTRPPGGFLLAATGTLAALLAGAAMRWNARSRRGAMALVVAGWTALAIGAQWIGSPALNALKSGRPLAGLALGAAGEGGAIASYRASYPGALNLYLRRDRIERFDEPEEVAAWRTAHGGGAIVSSDSDAEALARQIPGARLVACRRVGQESACVLALE